jgi:hypothetical protein
MKFKPNGKWTGSRKTTEMKEYLGRNTRAVSSRSKKAPSFTSRLLKRHFTVREPAKVFG